MHRKDAGSDTAWHRGHWLLQITRDLQTLKDDATRIAKQLAAGDDPEADENQEQLVK